MLGRNNAFLGKPRGEPAPKGLLSCQVIALEANQGGTFNARQQDGKVISRVMCLRLPRVRALADVFSGCGCRNLVAHRRQTRAWQPDAPDRFQDTIVSIQHVS